MADYDVHLYAVVRVKVTNIEARDCAEATRRADELVNLYQLTSARIEGASCIEWAEDVQEYLVDARDGSGVRDSVVIDRDHRVIHRVAASQHHEQ